MDFTLFIILCDFSTKITTWCSISENDGKHLIQKTELHFIKSNTNNSYFSLRRNKYEPNQAPSWFSSSRPPLLRT
jgi:hypothetical protein